MPVEHEVRNRTGGTRQVKLTPIKAIRYQCLECLGWSPTQVRYCTSEQCSLYPYRLGTNPSRGVGDKEEDMMTDEGLQLDDALASDV